MNLRIGVDVGGTNTDAVILDGRRLLAAAKRPTSADVTEGIIAALTAVIAEANVPPSAIGRVMIGTTHFTNAVVQRRDLRCTAVIRLGAPATMLLPPFVDWPADVVAAVHGQGTIVPGGFEFDGRAISPFDGASIRAAAASFRSSGVEAIVQSRPSSPRFPTFMNGASPPSWRRCCRKSRWYVVQISVGSDCSSAKTPPPSMPPSPGWPRRLRMRSSLH